jgi:hypothetical protein
MHPFPRQALVARRRDRRRTDGMRAALEATHFPFLEAVALEATGTAGVRAHAARDTRGSVFVQAHRAQN